jgi:hypothetical protein
VERSLRLLFLLLQRRRGRCGPGPRALVMAGQQVEVDGGIMEGVSAEPEANAGGLYQAGEGGFGVMGLCPFYPHTGLCRAVRSSGSLRPLAVCWGSPCGCRRSAQAAAPRASGKAGGLGSWDRDRSRRVGDRGGGARDRESENRGPGPG